MIFFFLNASCLGEPQVYNEVAHVSQLDKGAQPTIASHVKQTESTSNLCGVANKLRGESKKYN